MPASLYDDALAYLNSVRAVNPQYPMTADSLNSAMNWLAVNPDKRPSYREAMASTEDQAIMGMGGDPLETSALPANVPWRQTTKGKPQYPSTPTGGMSSGIGGDVTEATGDPAISGGGASGRSGNIPGAPPSKPMAPGMSGGGSPNASMPPIPKSKITIETVGNEYGIPGAGGGVNNPNTMQGDTGGKIPVTPPIGAPPSGSMASPDSGVNPAMASSDEGGSSDSEGSWWPWAAGGAGLAALLAMMSGGKGGARAARIPPTMGRGPSGNTLPDGPGLTGEIIPPDALPSPGGAMTTTNPNAFGGGRIVPGNPRLPAPGGITADPGAVPPRALTVEPVARGSMMEEFAPGYGSQTVNPGARSSREGLNRTTARAASVTKKNAPTPKSKPKPKAGQKKSNARK